MHKKIKKDPWQISATRFCSNKQDGFTQQELFDYLDTLGIHKNAQNHFFSDTIAHPAGYKYSRNSYKNKHGESIWSAPIEMISMVTDYDELKEARKNAQRAWWFSMIALVVASTGLILQWWNY